MLMYDAHIQVRGIGKTFDSLGPSVFTELDALAPRLRRVDASKADKTHSVYFDKLGRVDTPVFLYEHLGEGDELEGPAVVIDDTQTIVLIPGARAVVTKRHLVIRLE